MWVDGVWVDDVWGGWCVCGGWCVWVRVVCVWVDGGVCGWCVWVDGVWVGGVWVGGGGFFHG